MTSNSSSLLIVQNFGLKVLIKYLIMQTLRRMFFLLTQDLQASERRAFFYTDLRPAYEEGVIKSRLALSLMLAEETNSRWKWQMAKLYNIYNSGLHFPGLGSFLLRDLSEFLPQPSPAIELTACEEHALHPYILPVRTDWLIFDNSLSVASILSNTRRLFFLISPLFLHCFSFFFVTEEPIIFTTTSTHFLWKEWT